MLPQYQAGAERRELGRHRIYVHSKSLWTVAARESTGVQIEIAEWRKMLKLTSFTFPSHDDEAKVSFLIFDQSTEKTSRLCSSHARIGRS